MFGSYTVYGTEMADKLRTMKTTFSLKVQRRERSTHLSCWSFQISLSLIKCEKMKIIFTVLNKTTDVMHNEYHNRPMNQKAIR
jgi:hypothetical protein